MFVPLRRRQHMRNCTLSGNQLFQDILSYDLSLIGCSDGSSDEDVCAATGAVGAKPRSGGRQVCHVEAQVFVFVCREVHEEAVRL